MTLREKALEIAITQLGVQEAAGHHNTGADVEKYLKAVGLGPGYSWCMAFVYWCYQQAADAMGLQNPLAKTGGVLDQWNKRKAVYGTVHPMPGDLFIMDFGNGEGHTGLVEVADHKFIYPIEGNTNDDGSREGYEVCRRKRKVESIKGYLHFTI